MIASWFWMPSLDCFDKKKYQIDLINGNKSNVKSPTKNAKEKSERKKFAHTDICAPFNSMMEING